MAALSRKEREFEREFRQNHLATLRGDNFSVPLGANNSNFLGDDGENKKAANNNRSFPPDSEDGILAQYPLASPLSGSIDPAAIDPNNFSYIQQQARMQQGIGAPSLLPDDVANLSDPEVSTAANNVTFYESLQALEAQARDAEDIEEVQAAQSAVQQKIRAAIDQYTEMMQEKLRETTQRWMAKIAGNGTSITGSTGWDGFISGTLSYLYIMTRGAVTILSPESQAPEDFQTQGVRYTETKILHTWFPPYRLREIGDFFWFCFLCVMSLLVVCIVSAVLLTIMGIFLFPLIPGGTISP